jgi:hypothetical protein
MAGASLLSRLFQAFLIVLCLGSPDIALGFELLGKILLECHGASPFSRN